MRNLRIVCVLAGWLACTGLAGCGGGSSKSSNSGSPPNTIASSGGNVAPIAVNGGPVGNYVDGAFASVTLCVPGTSSCQTIGGVLVDTGSSGLREYCLLRSRLRCPSRKRLTAIRWQNALHSWDLLRGGQSRLRTCRLAARKPAGRPFRC